MHLFLLWHTNSVARCYARINDSKNQTIIDNFCNASTVEHQFNLAAVPFSKFHRQLATEYYTDILTEYVDIVTNASATARADIDGLLAQTSELKGEFETIVYLETHCTAQMAAIREQIYQSMNPVPDENVIALVHTMLALKHKSTYERIFGAVDGDAKKE